MSNSEETKGTKPGERYSEQELMVRLKVFIGCCLAITLIGIVFVVLYSIIFVTQPLNAMSPIDSKFFELIIPVATFLCGTLSGIMLAGTGREAAMAGMDMQKQASEMFKSARSNSPTPSYSAPSAPMNFSAPTSAPAAAPASLTRPPEEPHPEL